MLKLGAIEVEASIKGFMSFAHATFVFAHPAYYSETKLQNLYEKSHISTFTFTCLSRLAKQIYSSTFHEHIIFIKNQLLSSLFLHWLQASKLTVACIGFPYRSCVGRKKLNLMVISYAMQQVSLK
jgi:site-specific DNA-adenine methylase